MKNWVRLFIQVWCHGTIAFWYILRLPSKGTVSGGNTSQIRSTELYRLVETRLKMLFCSLHYEISFHQSRPDFLHIWMWYTLTCWYSFQGCQCFYLLCGFKTLFGPLLTDSWRYRQEMGGERKKENDTQQMARGGLEPGTAAARTYLICVGRWLYQLSYRTPSLLCNLTHSLVFTYL